MEVISVLVIIAAIIFIGVLGEFVFSKSRVPDVLWLVLIGVIVGPILGFTDANTIYRLAPFFSAIALIVIMFEGGLNLNIFRVIKNTPTSATLAVGGFAITLIAITVLTQILASFGILQDWTIAHGILLGSILGGSSSIIVFPMLKGARVKKSLSSILGLESSITDVLCVVIALAIIRYLILPDQSLQEIAQMIFARFGVGILFGFVTGIFWLYVLKFVGRWKSITNNNYMLTFAFLLFLYASTEYFAGNGAISCLVFGLVLGNASELSKMLKLSTEMGIDTEVKMFHEQVSFFVKTFFFALIGMLLVLNIYALAMGVLIGVAIFLVRPLIVNIVTFKGKTTDVEKRMMKVLVPRGLAAAVLAILAIDAGIPLAQTMAEFVFTAVVVSILITTIGVYFVLKNASIIDKKDNEVMAAMAK